MIFRADRCIDLFPLTVPVLSLNRIQTCEGESKAASDKEILLLSRNVPGDALRAVGSVPSRCVLTWFHKQAHLM